MEDVFEPSQRAEHQDFTARMTDIAHEAEVADGTLYLYFDGKEHLHQFCQRFRQPVRQGEQAGALLHRLAQAFGAVEAQLVDVGIRAPSRAKASRPSRRTRRRDAPSR